MATQTSWNQWNLERAHSFSALYVIIEMIVIVAAIVYLALDPSRLFILCIAESEKEKLKKGRKRGGKR